MKKILFLALFACICINGMSSPVSNIAKQSVTVIPIKSKYSPLSITWKDKDTMYVELNQNSLGSNMPNTRRVYTFDYEIQTYAPVHQAVFFTEKDADALRELNTKQPEFEAHVVYEKGNYKPKNLIKKLYRVIIDRKQLFLDTNCTDLKTKKVRVSPDGTKIATCRSDGNTIYIWDITDWEKTPNFTAKLLIKLEGHTEPINSVTWSDDSKTITSCSNDKTVRIWNNMPELIESAEKTIQKPAGDIKNFNGSTEHGNIHKPIGEMPKPVKQTSFFKHPVVLTSTLIMSISLFIGLYYKFFCPSSNDLVLLVD